MVITDKVTETTAVTITEECITPMLVETATVDHIIRVVEATKTTTAEATAMVRDLSLDIIQTGAVVVRTLNGDQAMEMNITLEMDQNHGNKMHPTLQTGTRTIVTCL